MGSISKVKLKETFEVESKHGAFYTGGNLEWIEDTLYCQTGSKITLLNIETGLIDQTIGEEHEEEDTIQTFTSDGIRTITSHKSGLLKLWNEKAELEKMWKYIHKGPIARLSLKVDKVASGGCDGVVRLWDIQNQVCLLSLKGCQGVVNVVEFHPEENILFASGDDGKINAYELTTGQLRTSYCGHFSKVTSFIFSQQNYFVTCGRDKVLILWKINTIEPLKIIPQYEAVETIVGLPLKFKLPGFKSEPDGIYVAAAGEKGVVSVWDVKKAKQVYLQNNSLVNQASEGGLAIVLLRCNHKDKSIAVVTTDHNIIIHHLKSFVCLKQFIGFSDEILDIVFVGNEDSHLAVATNSNDIKLYCNSSMTCQILRGHTDIVMSLASSSTNPELMLSSGKDNTIRLWKLDSGVMMCFATGLRHTGSVGAIAFSQTSYNFCVSASQDMCLKIWEIPKKIETVSSLNCTHTVLAHQKDINSVGVSPNDKIIATASQDKTAKLWSLTLELIGTLRGHKKSIWCIQFSPADQVVVTSSADCTIKLWSIADLSCLKTFEGHDASVLKVHFLSSGMQLLSAGADGLLKIFSIKTSECTSTLDQHEAQVWAIAVKGDESGIVTGGSDSVVIKWKDATEELRLQKLKEAEELVLQEQKLNNYLISGNYLKALKGALTLNKPFQVLKIIRIIIKNGDTGLADTIRKLRNDQKDCLLKFAINWNMNSKHSHPAQLIINILLNEMQSDNFKPSGLGSILEGALPYTERHMNRLTQLMQDLQLVNYIVKCMKPHSEYNTVL